MYYINLFLFSIVAGIKVSENGSAFEENATNPTQSEFDNPPITTLIASLATSNLVLLPYILLMDPDMSSMIIIFLGPELPATYHGRVLGSYK